MEPMDAVESIDAVKSMTVDGRRLWASLEEVSRIGATQAGGLHRLAGSEEDRLARDLVVAAAEAVGARRRVDEVGNTFLTLGPSDRRGILIGSHLDSQPQAGRYDGTYGVMAGLEVLRTLHDSGTELARPVTLVIWTDEEGARFAPAMLGSGVFAGRSSAADALTSTDADGVTLAHALSAIGYLGTDVVEPGEFDAYVEAHIEQGPILENEGIDIGVVEAVQAQYWTQVSLVGERAHAGTFPLEQRRDALLAAAEIVTGVREIGLQRPGVGRATVGRLDVAPNSPNVVPGEVDLTVEVRHPHQGELDAMLDEVLALVADVVQRHDLAVQTRQLLASAPVAFDPAVIDAVQEAAQAAGFSWRRMVSGAGHDAVPVSDHLPAGMVFVPCHGGVSHAEAESMTSQWAQNGAQVLLGAVLHLVQRPC